MDNAHLDRKRTQMIKGQEVTFTLLPPDSLTPPLEKVTSVAVVPFTSNGQIVTALLERGHDIPGGHMHRHETSFIETVKREAIEEAFITLKNIKTACIIQSDYYGKTDDKLTYMIIMVADVDEFLDIIPNEESKGRDIISTDDFIECYAGDKNLMSDIIHFAQENHSGR